MSLSLSLIHQDINARHFELTAFISRMRRERESFVYSVVKLASRLRLQVSGRSDMMSWNEDKQDGDKNRLLPIMRMRVAASSSYSSWAFAAHNRNVLIRNYKTLIAHQNSVLYISAITNRHRIDCLNVVI